MSHPGCDASALRAGMVLALVVGIGACGGEDQSTSPDDVTPPAAVNDLICIDSVGDGGITLSWTAPGDDSTVGRAAQYDLRYAYAPISDTNWDSARSVLIVSAPRPAGDTESVTLPNLTWWNTYHFALRTRDDSGNRSSISNVVAVTPFPDSSSRLLVRTRDGAYISDLYRNVHKLADADGEIEVSGDRIFIVADSASICEYDSQGAVVDTIPIPETVRADGLITLPGDRFALLNNVTDSIHVLDRNGHALAGVAMRDAPDDRRQNVKGVIVGNSAVISEAGDQRLLRLDLDSYTVRPFKDLRDLPGDPGDIDQRGGRYYLCAGRHVVTFTERGQPALIGHLDGGTLTGIAVAGGHCFLTVGATGTVYALSNATGQASVFINGLREPQDIELLSP